MAWISASGRWRRKAAGGAFLRDHQNGGYTRPHPYAARASPHSPASTGPRSTSRAIDTHGSMGVSMANEIRIHPNAHHREAIERTFGCPWVCNCCFEERRAAYENMSRLPTKFRQDRILPAWKSENGWFREADSHALQQAVTDLDGYTRTSSAAVDRHSKPICPRFRLRGDARQSCRTSQDVSVPDTCHVKLPKLGRVKARGPPCSPGIASEKATHGAVWRHPMVKVPC